MIVAPDEDYGCLIGQVTAIDKLGMPEHNTCNETDDIHVNLMLVEYSKIRMKEVLDAFKKLGSNASAFDEIALDNVILAPETLIRVTENELEEISAGLTHSLDEATLLIETIATRRFDELYDSLVARVKQNYADYNKSLLSFGKREIIDMAAKIHAINDAYSYMTAHHGYGLAELNFYLQFQNPLEIVAAAWQERNIDLDDMSFIMEYIAEHSDDLAKEHPLICVSPNENPASTPPPPRRIICPS